MAVQLRAGEKPPFLDEGETAKRRNGEAAKEEKKEETAKPFRIDLEGIRQRTWPLPVEAGNYLYLKAGKGKVAWCAIPAFTEDDYDAVFRPGPESKYALHIFDMAKKQEVVLDDKIRDYQVSANGEQIILRKGGDFFLTSVDKAFQSKKPGEKLSLDGMTYTVDTAAEWRQIFNDTWRWYRDFFYDAGMHGHDWKAVGDQLPRLPARALLARAAQLADVADGGRAVRRPRLHRRRRPRAGHPARDARVHRAPGRRPGGRPGVRPLPLRPDLRPDRVQPRPQGAAGAPRHPAPGGRLPDRHRRPRRCRRRRITSGTCR